MRATLLSLCLVGCGSVVNHLPDGPPGGDDDAQPDATVMPVKVTVLSYLGDGLPNPSATVVFSDEAGNLISDEPLSADGSVTATVPEGSNVTSIQITTDNASTLTAALTTVTALKPGDDITIGVKKFPTVRAQGGQTTMTANFTPPAGAGEVDFYTECGTFFSTTSPVTLTFRDSCHGANFDLLMVASGGTLVTPVSLKVTGIAHSDGGSFNITGTPIAAQTFTSNLTNLEANVSSITTTRSAIVNNTPFGGLSTTVSAPAAGSLAATAGLVQNVGTRNLVVESWGRTDATVQQRREVMTANLTSSTDIDLAAHRLPWLSGLASSTTGMSWTTVQGGASPDGMTAQWSGRWTTGDKVNTTVAWRLARPVSPTGSSLIKLPAKYARFDPSAQTGVTTSIAALFMVDYDALDGYDAYKAQADTLIVPSLTDVAPFAGMATGRNILIGTIRLGVD